MKQITIELVRVAVLMVCKTLLHLPHTVIDTHEREKEREGEREREKEREGERETRKKD